MSTSSDASLGALRIQARQRSDLENNPSVTDAEFNSYISNSYKRLYNMLVSAYGNDYFISSYYQFNFSGSQFYDLPSGGPSFVDANGAIASKFYKLIDVDLQYSASPNGWVTLKRFEEIKRNNYAWPNTAVSMTGYTNMKYRLSGNQLMFVPVPMAGQTCRIRYIPAPTNLQFMLPGSSVNGTNVVGSMSDTTGLTVGMNVYSSLNNVIPDSGITLSSVSTTTMTLSTTAMSSVANNIFSVWDDSTRLDGIAGFEEFVIIDAAIKAQIKQEGPTQELLLERQSMVDEIQSMAEGRDAGQAHHVSDVLGASGYGDFDDYGGGGFGWG